MTFDFKKEFFDTIATFVQTIAGWIIPASKNIAQISNGISNPVVAADKNIDLRWLSGGKTEVMFKMKNMFEMQRSK